ncbi:MAG: hypothetical protein KatS3mg131_1127 [Candidatus Tectimicrobiota bacterium]|nr:MAG: hypothetical protein KatS3mg131_1127 [Candidatus Tectomicrobia bacterium]
MAQVPISSESRNTTMEMQTKLRHQHFITNA